MKYYPIFLDLKDRPVLVVGAGKVGLRKTRALLEAGARVTVVAKGRGIFANIADSGAEGDFIVPARVQRGAVQIAVSTGGESPRLSAELRKRLEEVL